MESGINWSRIVGIIAIVVQVANFGLFYFAQYLSPDVALIVASAIAAVQAFSARVQGAPSK